MYNVNGAHVYKECVMNLQFNKFTLAVLSAFNVIFCPASLGINLILPKNDNFLKVGAKDGYILTFGNYLQDAVDPNAEVKSFTYRQPIAWRILDSENLDPQSNLAPTKAGETQTPEEAAAYGDAKGLPSSVKKC